MPSSPISRIERIAAHLMLAVKGTADNVILHQRNAIFPSSKSIHLAKQLLRKRTNAEDGADFRIKYLSIATLRILDVSTYFFTLRNVTSLASTTSVEAKAILH